MPHSGTVFLGDNFELSGEVGVRSGRRLGLMPRSSPPTTDGRAAAKAACAARRSWAVAVAQVVERISG